MMKIIIVLLVLVLTFSSVNSKRYDLGSAQEWEISWGNFNKNAEQFSLQNLISETLIVFDDVKNKDFKATNIGYTQSGYSYLRYEQKNCQMTEIQKCKFLYLIGKSQEGFIKINNADSKDFRFTLKQNTKDEQIITMISTNGLSKQNFKPIKQICSQTQRGFSCSFKSKQIFISIVKRQYFLNLKADQQVNIFDITYQQVAKNINSQIFKLMTKYYVDSSKVQLTETMLTATLDSICFQNSQYEGLRYFGLCKQNSNKFEIQLHYSLLVIQVILQYNYKLGAWLFQNYLNFIQQKMFYTRFNQVEWIAIPQHIEVTSSYMKIMKSLQQNQVDQKQKNIIRMRKVQKILNGFINQNLLSEVNHLSQEINYRQTNKLHPTLLKMLTLNWKGTDSKKMGLSIYDESFTNDFYYHQKTETVNNNVGKIMWLIKLLNQYIALLKNYGDQFQKESLEQAISLAKVVHGYSLDDPHTKNGDFFSIIRSQNIRVYSKQFGYQSFLPYIYQVTQTFPESTLRNLTTVNGLSSMSPLSQKVNEKFNFRGNVHLYFNYKILFKALFLTMSQKQNMGYYMVIRQMTKKYQQKIIQTFSVWQKTKKGNSFYSVWNGNGVGLKSERYLAIMNAVFLTNINQFDTKMNTQKQNIQKNQAK